MHPPILQKLKKRMAQTEHINILKFIEGKAISVTDQVAVEEPLEIQLAYSTSTGRMQKPVAVTMRTPGHDRELAAGFLFTEGIIRHHNTIEDIRHIPGDENRIVVAIKENILPNLQKAERNFYTTSSCGVCGKASIDAIETGWEHSPAPDSIVIQADLLYSLRESAYQSQPVFEATGGLHASTIFNLDGSYFLLREDVGRHNALDKLIGFALLSDRLPLGHCILLLSGRASFELLQKAAMAGIKIVVALGAPSSLAVELAKDAGITLVGFLKPDRFNIYSGEHRIKTDSFGKHGKT